MRARLLVVLAATACVLAGCGSSTSPDEGIDVSAALEVDPATGTAITDFTFDASGSTAGRRALEYRWDWDGDGAWDTEWSSESVVTHRFTDGDTVTVNVQAREGDYTGSATAEIVLDSRHGYVLEELETGQRATAMGYHDGSFWTSDWSSPCQIFRIDPATGDTLYSIPAPSLWPCGICSDGTDLYVSDFRYHRGVEICKVDATDGTVLSYFPVEYTSFPSGLTWDGEYFYHPSWYTEDRAGDGLIHKYAPDGTEVGTLPCPRGSLEPDAIGYDGRDLWVTLASVDTLYVIDRENGDVLRTVPLPYAIRDLEVIDDHLWLLMNIQGGMARLVP
jgi:hypothetical protein